jgi:hypothetical protein
MLRLIICMFSAVQCGPGLVTTNELNLEMDRALANGWQPAQKPLENAPLAIAPSADTTSTYVPYLSSI